MINWRIGKAGFVGASKYLIKGFFNYAYSVTSAEVITPSVTTGLQSTISASNLGLSSPVSGDVLGLVSQINQDFSVLSLISSSNLGLQSTIDGNVLGLISLIQ